MMPLSNLPAPHPSRRLVRRLPRRPVTSGVVSPRTPLVTLAAPLALSMLLAACASSGGRMAMPAYSQAALPAAVQVPAGHRVALETVGVGEITYECRDKANAAGQTEWVFAGPDAKLMDRANRQIGTYYGPPATWESLDGSKITGAQVAVAPAGEGNIPYQLVKANPASGNGAMTGVTYIQRVALKGGVAPALPCTAADRGKRAKVAYQADYIFWKAG